MAILTGCIHILLVKFWETSLCKLFGTYNLATGCDDPTVVISLYSRLVRKSA